MSTDLPSPADERIDPRQGDLLELLETPPDPHQRSRDPRRHAGEQESAEASSRPRAGAWSGRTARS